MSAGDAGRLVAEGLIARERAERHQDDGQGRCRHCMELSIETDAQGHMHGMAITAAWPCDAGALWAALKNAEARAERLAGERTEIDRWAERLIRDVQALAPAFGFIMPASVGRLSAALGLAAEPARHPAECECLPCWQRSETR